MATEAQVRESFAKQSGWCIQLGSPFTALLCGTLGERIDRSTVVGRRVLDWPGEPDALADALPLRLAGALHALVRRGDAQELASLYPPNPTPTADALWRQVQTAFAKHEAYILPRLDLAPQTNEVGRAGPIMAGLMVLSRQFPLLKFKLLELGSSAGLMLNLLRYDYDLGGARIERHDPPENAGSPRLLIKPQWTGPAPPQLEHGGGSARGVDLSPLSIADPDHRELLTAYVWPDQPERLARVTAAIEIGLRNPPNVEQGEASEWLMLNLVGPAEGLITVVMHTIAFQYFPPESQSRIRDHLGLVGAKASPDAPLAWLRYEADPAFDNKASLRLTLWPDGTERVLGVGHPHGSTFRFF